MSTHTGPDPATSSTTSGKLALNGSTRTDSSPKLQLTGIEGVLVRPNGKRSALGLPNEIWLRENRLSLVWRLRKKKDIEALRSPLTRMVTTMGPHTIEKPIGDPYVSLEGDAVISIVQQVTILL